MLGECRLDVACTTSKLCAWMPLQNVAKYDDSMKVMALQKSCEWLVGWGMAGGHVFVSGVSEMLV